MAIAEKPEMVLPFWAALVSPRIEVHRVLEFINLTHNKVLEAAGPIDFDDTDYYLDEMGPDLKRFWVKGTKLIRPDKLSQLKREANEIEFDLATIEGCERPVNLDPGYVDLYSVVAATCKKLPAAVYLGDGIYGYLQLLFRGGAFDTVPWTYPDYAAAADIFADFRKSYLKLRKSEGT
ncbi:MAG: DUF4416 family protein [bacterium]|nr:DUF4416 family protein [bacterium]